MIANATELAIHRANTKIYIDSDPVEIVLRTRVEEWVAGTKKFEEGSPRAGQRFKIIWSGSTGFTYTIEGLTRRFDFILVGEYDAVVEITDFWRVNSQDNEIQYIFPSNGYEVKCGGVSHGGAPSG